MGKRTLAQVPLDEVNPHCLTKIKIELKGSNKNAG